MACSVFSYTISTSNDGIDDGYLFGIEFPAGSDKNGLTVNTLAYGIYRSGSCSDFTPQLKHYEDTSLIATYDMDDTWNSLPTSPPADVTATWTFPSSITITDTTRFVVVGVACTMRFSTGTTDLPDAANTRWIQRNPAGVWSTSSRMMVSCVDGAGAASTGGRLPPPPIVLGGL